VRRLRYLRGLNVAARIGQPTKDPKKSVVRGSIMHRRLRPDSPVLVLLSRSPAAEVQKSELSFSAM
jgi:hypothetical protein